MGAHAHVWMDVTPASAPLPSTMPETPYLIGDLPGYTPAVARLVSIINYARLTTVMTVADLKTDALDFRLDERANTI